MTLKPAYLNACIIYQDSYGKHYQVNYVMQKWLQKPCAAMQKPTSCRSNYDILVARMIDSKTQ